MIRLVAIRSAFRSTNFSQKAIPPPEPCLLRSLSTMSNHLPSTDRPVPPTSQSLNDLIEELKSQGISLEPHPCIDERQEPWKKLIGVPARAAWRVGTARPPPDFQRALDKILVMADRTRKQLKQSFRLMLKSHAALSQRRERERIRLVNNRQYLEPERRTDEGIKPIFYGPSEALATLYFRSFPQYTIVKRILSEAKSLLGETTWKPQRVLDFGVGAGSASAAAIHTWNDGSIEWVHSIDASETMRQLAEYFLANFIEQPSEEINRIKTTFAPHLSSAVSSDVQAQQNFDLALLAFTASEFAQNSSTVAVAAMMFDKLRPGGLFVMVEPGTPDGFNSIRTVRKMLLECCPSIGRDEGDEECHIIAPCTHNGRCPMERLQYNRQKHKARPTETILADEDNLGTATATSDYEDPDSDDDDGDEDVESFGEDDDDGILSRGYCSFVQTMPSAQKGKGEKFSYLVAQKRISGELLISHKHRFEHLNLRDLLEHTGSAAYQVQGEWSESPDVLLKRAVDLEKTYSDNKGDLLGLDFLQSGENRQSYGRIVHAPKKRRGHVLIDTCVGPGKIVRNKVNKSLSKAIPGIFSAARKSRWGGFWPIVEELQEDGTFQRKK